MAAQAEPAVHRSSTTRLTGGPARNLQTAPSADPNLVQTYRHPRGPDTTTASRAIEQAPLPLFHLAVIVVSLAYPPPAPTVAECTDSHRRKRNDSTQNPRQIALGRPYRNGTHLGVTV